MFASSASGVQSKQTNGATPPSSAPCSSAEYNKQLTALNCSVRDWIAKHVNDNPLCDLNPIFRDYERHLATIERQYGAANADAGSGDAMAAPPLPPAAAAPSPPSSSSLFPFSKGAPEVKPPPGVTFNFGQKVDGSLLASVGSQPPPSAFSFTSSSQSSLVGGGQEATPTAGTAAVPGVGRLLPGSA